MQETMTQERCNQTAQQAVIDFPQENERVTAEHYSFRIRAPREAQRVEVSIDESAWQPCRLADGFWWLDWTATTPGQHELVAKIQPLEGEQLVRTRRFHVDLRKHGRSLENQPKPLQERLPGERQAQFHNAAKVTQYQVLFPNEPQMLARMSHILEQKGIDIAALMTVTLAHTACVHFTADREHGVRQALEAAGFQVIEEQALELELPNEPGVMHRLIRTLAEQNVEVHCLYATSDGSRSAKAILTVRQQADAERLLQKAQVASYAPY